jgi:hypothetical protein
VPVGRWGAHHDEGSTAFGDFTDAWLGRALEVGYQEHNSGAGSSENLKAVWRGGQAAEIDFGASPMTMTQDGKSCALQKTAEAAVE